MYDIVFPEVVGLMLGFILSVSLSELKKERMQDVYSHPPVDLVVVGTSTG